MNDADVVIVGAGLTGLRAAVEISRAGLSVLVVEKGDDVGGRMRTSKERGCLLDHGFQVLLDGYPELQSLPSLESLHLKSFWCGARVRVDSRFHDILDPRRHPSTLAASLTSPLVSLADVLRLGLFVETASSKEIRPTGLSTSSALTHCKFSELFKGSFLCPFLRGVLLDPRLSTDSGLTRFYLKMFSRGRASLPENGIQALPDLLADTLGRQHIVFNAPTVSILADRVVLQSGEDISARMVLCAVDALSAAALGGPEQTVPHFGATTLYFLAEKAPFTEPLIVLNSTGSGPINSLAVLSNVQPSYAPAGLSLISATAVGDDALRPEDDLLHRAREQFHDWFGYQAASWEHIKTFYIPQALPARPRLTCGWAVRDRIMYAGDYLSYGSQNGALSAGRQAATEMVSQIMQDLM